MQVVRLRDKPAEHVAAVSQTPLPPSASTTNLQKTLEDLEDLFIAFEISWCASLARQELLQNVTSLRQPGGWNFHKGLLRFCGPTSGPHDLLHSSAGKRSSDCDHAHAQTGTDSTLLPLAVFHDLTEFIGVQQRMPLDLYVQDAGFADLEVAFLARVGITVVDENGAEEMLMDRCVFACTIDCEGVGETLTPQRKDDAFAPFPGLRMRCSL
ncbi:hypothetical protein EJ03DRAFT_176102 [Teratosphaeria nubilosa]|uniref:Uncharacterized protein n=1 Tax=Teratosphaeria nubilosa TaxID=161662 RepID=A0A6G1L1M5_9PEZI|nr:hypothetical protein EJ03DRAFT_176102 [Teratosphaeria nubilosa]